MNRPNYLEILAEKEAKFISMASLQEGEEFERDINNIMDIIDDVEKNMSQAKLTNQFNRR